MNEDSRRSVVEVEQAPRAIKPPTGDPIHVKLGGRMQSRLARALVVGMLVVFAARFMVAVWTQGLAPDEMQHFHAAWLIGKGQMPYRDFFEHHPPTMWYMASPFVKDRTDVTRAFIVGCRCVGVGVMVLLAWAIYRWYRRQLPAELVPFAVVAALLVNVASPFEVRPDFLALALAVFAVERLTSSLPHAGGRIKSGSVFAGLAMGAAMCLTQKVLLLLLAIMIWWMAAIVLRKASRVSRAKQFGAFLVASAAAPLILIAFFASPGGVGWLVHGVIEVNAHWAREIPWWKVWTVMAPVGFGVFVVAAIGLAGGLSSVRKGLQDANASSLAVILLVTGIGGVLTSPAPWAQSYLLFVVPWAVFLAFDAGGRMNRGRLPLMHSVAAGGAVVVLAASLPHVVAVKVIAVWVPVLFGTWFILRKTRSLQIAAACLMAVPLLVNAREVIYMMRARGESDPVDVALQREVPPPAPVLSMWYVIRPFQDIPVYHWFAHPGLIHTIGGESLAAEYIDALEAGRARFIVVSSRNVDEAMPSLHRYLREHARLVATSNRKDDYADQLYMIEEPLRAETRPGQQPSAQINSSPTRARSF